MARKIVWTEGQDTRIRRLRAEGASWDVIAEQLAMTRWTVIERAARIGVPRPLPTAAMLHDLTRDPLRAGHPDSWGVINLGTALNGLPFPVRAVIR